MRVVQIHSKAFYLIRTISVWNRNAKVKKVCFCLCFIALRMLSNNSMGTSYTNIISHEYAYRIVFAVYIDGFSPADETCHLVEV